MNKIVQDKGLATTALGTLLCAYFSYKIINSLLLNRTKKYSSASAAGIKEIPVPSSSIPYVGHLFSLGSLPSETVSEWHKELGPIIKFRMGVQTWISIDNPQMAHKLMVTNGAKVSHRPISEFGQELYSMGGKGIVYGQPHSSWSKIRGALVTAIGPPQIQLHMASIQNEAKKLVDRLLETSLQTETGGVYPFEDLQLYVMNSVILIGFGKIFTSKQDPEFIKLTGIVDDGFLFAGVDYDLANYLPVLAVMDFFTGAKACMRQFISKTRNPTYIQLIKEGLKTEGPNLVKYLKENQYNLSEEETIVVFSDLVAAGTDTNSVFLCWTIAILCHHPSVQKKASAEVDAFVLRHGRLPNFNERLELPFCISLLKECIRYRPVTSFGLPHECCEDVELDGYVIPKGASVITNMVSMHKNPDVYPDRPNEFLPERFMNALETTLAASNGKIEDRDHFNFGWGRRICPAIHLAEVEMFVGLIEILSRCTIEPTAKDGLPDINGARHGGISILPLPYKVKFTKRDIPLVNISDLADPSLSHL